LLERADWHHSHSPSFSPNVALEALMKGIGKAVRCDGCDTTLLDYRGVPTPGAVLCDSLVAGATDVVLCKTCSNVEFEEEEKAGTNNLPHLLAKYRQQVEHPPEEL
jgi:hypothetical protein